MSNRFKGVYRRFYHKIALILFTLCVCLQKFPYASTIFHREVRFFTYIRVTTVEKYFVFATLREIVFIVVFVYVVL